MVELNKTVVDTKAYDEVTGSSWCEKNFETMYCFVRENGVPHNKLIGKLTLNVSFIRCVREPPLSKWSDL